MNRRQFIAGLAASTAPMVVVSASSWQAVIDAEVFASFPPTDHLRALAYSFQQMKEVVAANIMNEG